MIDTKKYKIGIIGHGFLGEAMVHGFALHTDIKIYDKYKPSDSIEDVVSHSDIIFLCLPTPMFENSGKYNLSIIEENINKISSLSYKKIVVIRSTVEPGTARKFSIKYPELSFVSNPEFLTARSNRLDFINSSRIILGGNDDDVNKIYDLYRHRFGKSINIFCTSWEAAELTKLSANCFFATKVIYFNMIYNLCKSMNLDYDEIKDMILADGRIGRSHCDVPGHDGSLGFGGLCFPKDINAMIRFLELSGDKSDVLKSVWTTNLEYRSDRDWESLESAVTICDE